MNSILIIIFFVYFRVNWAYTAVIPRNRDGWVQVHVSFVTRELKQVINEEVLDSIFSSFGEVADITIKRYVHDTTGQVQSGYGFVFFYDSSAAAAAVKRIRKVLIHGVTYDSSLSYRSEKELSIKSDESPKNSTQALNFRRSPPSENYDLKSSDALQSSSSPAHHGNGSLQYMVPSSRPAMIPSHYIVPGSVSPTYLSMNQNSFPPTVPTQSMNMNMESSYSGSRPFLVSQTSPAPTYVPANSSPQHIPYQPNGNACPAEVRYPVNHYVQQSNFPVYSNYPGQQPQPIIHGAPVAPQFVHQYFAPQASSPTPPMIHIPSFVPQLPHLHVDNSSFSQYGMLPYPASPLPSPVAHVIPSGVPQYSNVLEMPGSHQSTPTHSSHQYIPMYGYGESVPSPTSTSSNQNTFIKSNYSPRESYYARPPVGHGKRTFERSSPRSIQDISANASAIMDPSQPLSSSSSGLNNSVEKITIGIGALSHSTCLVNVP